MFIGLDFGTTNSALAFADPQGRARLAPIHHGTEYLSTFRSLLYYDPEERDRNNRPLSFAGPFAKDAYLERGAEGRLIQSIKSYLANPHFTSTQIFGARFTLENLIAHLIAGLIDATDDPVRLSETLANTPIVVGRPARFVRSSQGETDDGHDEFALDRLAWALKTVPIGEVVFEFEPVAAAYAYEQTLDRDELVLIGDFGGGTSDFCLLHVGPGYRTLGSRAETIVGVSGVGLAGDAFDARLVENVVAPALGYGTFYDSQGKRLPVPAWLYDTLKRWHLVSFINTAKTRRMLQMIEKTAEAPEAVEALARLIAEEQAFALHGAVEATKVALSKGERARFRHRLSPLDLDVDVSRADFETWIAPELAAIGACVDELMETTGIASGMVDRVFLTGGSSFIPAVRDLFAERFGAGKLAGGNELTSVATGLALSARARFAQ